VPAIGVQIAVDEEGEVLARSNHVFAGYWEQPEETAAALEGGWFHTGDGGYLDGPYLVISDRKKDVIITGGENVSSIEVEDCLYQHPAVAEVAVIGVPDEKWGETIKALVVLREGRRRRGELIAHCRIAWPTSRRRPAWSSATRSTARPPASCRSTSSASPTGRAGLRRGGGA
jgi:fatty-acyl-CoA synthase